MVEHQLVFSYLFLVLGGILASYLAITDFILSSNKSHNIIVSWGQINVDGYQYWLLVTIIASQF